jgi:hypothetical protein
MFQPTKTGFTVATMGKGGQFEAAMVRIFSILKSLRPKNILPHLENRLSHGKLHGGDARGDVSMTWCHAGQGPEDCCKESGKRAQQGTQVRHVTHNSKMTQIWTVFMYRKNGPTHSYTSTYTSWIRARTHTHIVTFLEASRAPCAMPQKKLQGKWNGRFSIHFRVFFASGKQHQCFDVITWMISHIVRCVSERASFS